MAATAAAALCSIMYCVHSAQLVFCYKICDMNTIGWEAHLELIHFHFGMLLNAH